MIFEWISVLVDQAEMVWHRNGGHPMQSPVIVSSIPVDGDVYPLKIDHMQRKGLQYLNYQEKWRHFLTKGEVL